MEEELTRAEQLAIDLLSKAARHWPESLWLFSASGTLHVMKKVDEKRVMDGEGVNQAYSVAIIDIENDGGD